MTTTALQKLLQYPQNAVFDKTPAPVRALVLGEAWEVADGVLTVGGDAYQLAEYTLASLVDALPDGASLLAPELASRSALALVEGSGDAGQPLDAFTSLLWVLLSGFAREVLGQRHAVQQALLQMNLNTSNDEWLDLYGALYGGTTRRQGEADGAYGPRIKAEALRLRVNKYGIERAVYDATGYRVAIEEPWEGLFILDQSLLSGGDRMYDGATVGPHLIQPVALVPGVEWGLVLPVIERNKAAGVIVLEPITRATIYVDTSSTDQGARVAMSGRMVARSIYEDIARLDYMTLDGDATVPVHPAALLARTILTSGVTVPTLTWGDLPGWTGGSWAGSTYYAWDAASNVGFEVERSHVVYGDRPWNPEETWASGGWAGGAPVVSILLSSVVRPPTATGTINLESNPLAFDGSILVYTP